MRLSRSFCPSCARLGKRGCAQKFENDFSSGARDPDPGTGWPHSPTLESALLPMAGPESRAPPTSSPNQPHLTYAAIFGWLCSPIKLYTYIRTNRKFLTMFFKISRRAKLTKQMRQRTAAFTLVVLVLIASAKTGAAATIPIDSERELFLDDHLIASMQQ